MKRKILSIILLIVTICSLSACSNEKTTDTLNSFYQDNFTMYVYKTTFNGSNINSYPSKVFKNNELFNVLNTATGEKSIKVDDLKILYKIALFNGQYMTEYYIYNDGVVDMSYNLINKNVFYLEEKQLDKLIEIIER